MVQVTDMKSNQGARSMSPRHSPHHKQNAHRVVGVGVLELAHQDGGLWCEESPEHLAGKFG